MALVIDVDRQIDKCLIEVRGMTCASCVANIERNLRRLTGVESVTVALIAGTAEVRYDGARLLPTQIAQYITDLGYSSSLIELARQDRVELLVRACTRTVA